MALTTIFGINGVGKDTVANELRIKNTDISVTSMSRVLMYILDITKTYDVSEKVCEDQYKKLESVPQSKMIEIENTDYKKILCEIAKSDKNVLMLSHLISALRHGEQINYLTDRLTPDWYVDANNALIQLVAPFNVISERRKNDQTRNRNVDISEIEYHQSLCTNEWERIKRVKPETINKMFIVENVDLSKATNDIENIMKNKVKILKLDGGDNK